MSEHIEWGEAGYVRKNFDVVAPGTVDGADEPNLQWAITMSTGSASVVIQGTIAELIELGTAIAIAAEGVEPGFIAIINTPGYLPVEGNPVWFETAREAWEYLADQRREHEDDTAEEGFEGFTAIVNRLEQLQRGEFADEAGVDDLSGVGVVYGKTPGYDGEHDLGLAYVVTAAE